MYPLICNDRNLTPTQILEAHKGQPTIEKRFEQIKTVHEIAPVFLKNTMRIEAFFTLYFLALLVQALIERELRLAMKREKIKELPIYPEQRLCKRPTTEQILRLFSLAERHTLLRDDKPVQSFPPQLTDTQRPNPRSTRRPGQSLRRLIAWRKFTPNYVRDVRNVRRDSSVGLLWPRRFTGAYGPRGPHPYHRRARWCYRNRTRHSRGGRSHD